MNSNGYNVKWSDGTTYGYSVSGLQTRVDYTKIFRNYRLYVIPNDSTWSYYWLASPFARFQDNLLIVTYFGDVSGDGNYQKHCVRPLVCLQSGIQLVSNRDGTYKLSK